MPDIIHLLPDTIANQIAAGEVIQRPASVVKELLENSVDAGATEIKLIIKDSGKVLIQVMDNGSGMSQTDARMCFEKHATSKITSVNDLFAIRTMGFRGEALASMAAIAQVELKTKLHSEELGTKICIEGFELKSQEPCQCAGGTSISVKNLFYNVPARRNFLKSNTVELKHVIDEFERVAIANAGIFFSMHHNGVEIFHLKPANLRQRIMHIFGNNYNEKLVPAEENTSVTNIHGFIGKPDSAKKTKGEQFFFVNNRFIRSNYLNHAVMSAYRQLLPEDSYPLYVIFIDIEPARIDVNVHPTKQEIKFEDERIIYTFIQAAVKHALAQYSITPTLDFNQDPTFSNLPSFYKKNTAGKEEETVLFKTVQSRMNEIPVNTDFKRRFEKLFLKQDEIPAEKNENAPLIKLSAEKEWEERTDNETATFQMHNQYIVCQIKSGFIVIDQQAAHERILFEKYILRLLEKKHFTQQQLFPRTVNLSSADAAILHDLLPEIRNLGFDIEHFGKDTFVMHGIPPELNEVNELQVIEDLIEQFKENLPGAKQGRGNLKISRHELIAKTMAKSNAVKSGKKLSRSEMKNLIDELFACNTPYLSPGGNLTFLTFGLEDLSKQFQKNN